MRILTLTVILGLPLMALAQTESQQQTTTQGQANEPQTTAPVKGKKTYTHEAGKTETRPETGISTREQTNVRGHTRGATRTETGVHSGTTQTNVQEFKSRHSEVFNLGRHPKEFFIQRYGANHVRLIGNTYFAFVDGCWVAVDVDGFVYSQRVICAGDPDFIEVD